VSPTVSNVLMTRTRCAVALPVPGENARKPPQRSELMTWETDELTRIGTAEELRLATRRGDGSLSAFTTMWVVQSGDQLYVRSAYGPEAVWYRRARRWGQGRIRAGGIERDVSFVDIALSDADTHAALDAAYHAKYDRHGSRVVATVIGPAVAAVTLRLDPLG
jgi:hypothetical protein